MLSVKITLKRKCLCCHSWLFRTFTQLDLTQPQTHLSIFAECGTIFPDIQRPDENTTALTFLLKFIIQCDAVFSSNIFMTIIMIIDFENPGKLLGLCDQNSMELKLLMSVSRRKHDFCSSTNSASFFFLKLPISDQYK